MQKCDLCKEKVKWHEDPKTRQWAPRCWNCHATYDSENRDFFDQEWACNEIRRLRQDNARLQARDATEAPKPEPSPPPKRFPPPWPHSVIGRRGPFS